MSEEARTVKSGAGPTLAERLGYGPEDRLLILHADDFGMCHAANEATIRALEAGIVTCASVMVPCPWMPEAARYAREHPDADIGVHLTLTSEWDRYRWGPVSPGETASLTDAEGYFPRSTREAVEQQSPEAVERECRAQIERARAFGFRPTHIDSHMGTLFNRRFFSLYARLGKEAGLPPMLVLPDRPIEDLRPLLGDDPASTIDALRRDGYLFLDRLGLGIGGDTLESRRESCYAALRDLSPGVTEIILHLSTDDAEIRAITSHWEARWHEFLIFTDPRTRDLIDSLGIRLIGYRDLAKIAFAA